MSVPTCRGEPCGREPIVASSASGVAGARAAAEVRRGLVDTSIVCRAGAATDVGHARTLNEDAHLVAAGCYVVADGMGGHRAGDVASGIAVRVMADLVGGAPDLETVAETVLRANAEIHARGVAAGATMGTTLVALVEIRNGAEPAWALCNVGDSRCYRMADGRLQQLTQDHSYVAELIASGAITAAEARARRDRNVITRALGSDPEVRPDFWVLTPVPRERFLLCSDGLTGELDDADLQRLLAVADEPAGAAAALVARVLEGRARDNVTVVVVQTDAIATPAGSADEDTLDRVPRPEEDTLERPPSRATRAPDRRRSRVVRPVGRGTRAAVPTSAEVVVVERVEPPPPAPPGAELIAAVPAAAAAPPLPPAFDIPTALPDDEEARDAG